MPLQHILCDRLFDGERFRQGPLRIDLAEGLIRGIEEGEPALTSLRGAAFDARGATVLPGLVDAHVHLPRRGQFEASELPSVTAVAANLRRTLAAGVTTVGDMGCAPGLIGVLRQHTRTDPLAGPSIRAAGPVVTAPRGYPLDWMPPLLVRTGAAVACDGEVEARRVVEHLARGGADHVKLAIMHRSYADAPLAALGEPVARALVAEAHALGLRAVAHAHSVADYRVALGAGVDALMHSSFEPLDAELVARVRDAGIPVCPTLWVFESVCLGIDGRWDRDAARTGRLDPAVKRSWRRFAEAWDASGDVVPPGIAGGLPKARAREGARIAAANLLLLADAGVPIAFGDDAPYGFATLARPADELAAMHRAGLSIASCLQAATGNAAALLGLHDRGRIAPGQRADIVVVPATLEHDLAALERPLLVMVEGRAAGDAGAGSRLATIAAIVRGMATTVKDALAG